MSNPLAALGLSGKSRKVRHRKMTAEKWAILEHEAELLAQRTAPKELALQLGLAHGYVCQILSELVKQKRGEVPRVTHKFSCTRDSRATYSPSEGLSCD